MNTDPKIVEKFKERVNKTWMFIEKSGMISNNTSLVVDDVVADGSCGTHETTNYWTYT